MTSSLLPRSARRRRVVATAAALPLLVTGLATAGIAASDAAPSSKPAASATAAKPGKPSPKSDVKVQVLSFNDYHGYLDPPTGSSANLGAADDPALTPVGGAEYLSTHLGMLREGAKHSTTVAAGDLIGGTPFLSGLFHDEPSVETLNAMGLDVSGVGNHEFDEGVDELLRMQRGGCHPEDGCYLDEPYAGADFDWLAANVRYKEGTPKAGKTVLPPYWVKRYEGVKVAYIGMTLEGTDQIVAAAGIRDVEFLDEAETANKLVRKLKREQGIEAFVVLLHEGGFAPGTYDGCEGTGGGLSDPIRTIVDNFVPAIDLVVTGHTHSPYICNIPDQYGRDRYVTSASSFGRVVTETWLPLNRRTKDVRRDAVTSVNHLVTQDVPKDAALTDIITKWKTIADPIANEVVGSVTTDILRGATRQVEGSLVNLIADAQLSVTAPDGAQLALMNPGGVRADLTYAPSPAGEAPGEVTYGEAFTVQPFGNLLVTISMTGAQIEQVLEQQFQNNTITGLPEVRLLLGVSDGLTYTYELSRPFGDKIDPATLQLNGVTLDPAATYRVAVNSFLADGGDAFTAFTQGTDRVVWGEDLPALIDYLGANSPVAPAPTDRVTELP